MNHLQFLKSCIVQQKYIITGTEEKFLLWNFKMYDNQAFKMTNTRKAQFEKKLSSLRPSIYKNKLEGWKPQEKKIC